MPVVFGHHEAVVYTSGNISASSGGLINIPRANHDKDNPVGLSVVPEWDPSFHGSVHTATIAVCTVLVIFVVVLGTFGNGLVLITALQCRRLRSNFDVLVYNLAGADFIVCSCLAPTFLYLLFSAPPSAPREFCGGFLFACTLCGLASLLTLMAIACHRQSRVTGKVKGALTTRRTAAILGAIYVISLGAALGGTLHVTLAWSDSQTSCQAVINSSEVTSNNVILFFVTPVVAVSCVTILVSYCVIARAVRTQTYLRVKALQPLLQNSGYSRLPPTAEVTPGSGSGKSAPSCSEMKQILIEDGDPPEFSKTRQSSQTPFHTKTIHSGKREVLRHCTCCSCMAALDKENKAISMCLVVILIIALCWTPLVISHVIELFTGESIILYQVKLCGIALVFLNSALDPYMYAQNCSRSSHGYGSFLWDVFRCECRLPRHSRTKIRSKPYISPSNRALRNPTGTPTTNLVLKQDCATLQFLHPTEPPPLKENPHSIKTYSRDARNNCCNFNPSKSGTNGVVKTKHHRGYSNNILKFGPANLAPTEHYQKTDMHNIRRTHAQAGKMRDVRNLVHKSCCHGNLPDDLSLIDS
ncbi:hypothetical protein RRG08_062500 [Elysia crispata]|uniref:G-protein coupled receptors family 1 profile domain-containing protein n=1 Tax=Elysia crispata TaxID=231223 RepID=A0AAE0ZXF5_9GAST|nr:hypothetical protein RRG08_062500 [Elysia crispata]